MLRQIRQQLEQLLWGPDTRSAPWWRHRLVGALRLAFAVGRDLRDGQLTLRAMGLVYTTLLSIVPLLALAFSVLKAFGVHNQIRPALLTLVEPLGARGVDLADEIIGFVENMRVGVLGAIGLALLVYTVISLLQKIEAAFNHVWRVARPRPFSQRFSQYLSVLVIGPVLVFAALGVTATLLNASVVQALATIEPFGSAIETLGRLVPYLLVIGAFAFIYVFIPNTRVRVSSALVGATVAGLLWQSVGWGFATFVADSPKYFAIYAGFAIVIVAMIWLYLAWLIVLFGSSLAFYHQHPEYLAARRREPRLSNRQREQLALRVIGLVGNNYYRNAAPWSLETLAHRLHVPQVSVEELLRNLTEAGFLAETTAEPPRYLPARAFENVPVTELLEAVRRADEEPAVGFESEAPVERCVARIGSAVNEALHDQTLRDLAGDTADRSPNP